MLHLGSTYLIVKDIEKSMEFYEKLLQMKPTANNLNRWVQFDFDGKCIALYNKDFDKKMIEAADNLEQHYNGTYLRYYNERKINYGNNMVLNFWIEDLKEEYERIKALNIGIVSEIMYINISSPYHFFVIEDPDGNTIEITGGYQNEFRNN
ncbi:MAG: VOC family protein [Bacillota bacterium]|nr:VOC family protein [Bacillota bacterium]